jgi:hypothetical protein
MHRETRATRNIEIDGRLFLIEPDPSSPGWLLREFYRDGWPVMGGPFPTAAEAIAYIDTLIAAGPLCDYQDEHGYQSCSV